MRYKERMSEAGKGVVRCRGCSGAHSRTGKGGGKNQRSNIGNLRRCSHGLQKKKRRGGTYAYSLHGPRRKAPALGVPLLPPLVLCECLKSWLAMRQEGRRPHGLQEIGQASKYSPCCLYSWMKRASFRGLVQIRYRLQHDSSRASWHRWRHLRLQFHCQPLRRLVLRLSLLLRSRASGG